MPKKTRSNNVDKCSVVNVQFNPIFREANRTKKRYRILYGSAGSGKSVNVAQDYVLKLADPRNKGMNLMVVRGVEQTHRNSTYAELTGAINRIWGFERAEEEWAFWSSPLKIQNRRTGNEIIFRGMADEKQRERIKSVTFSNGKLTDVWIEEATEIRKDDLEILDDRLRGELTNPNLFYQLTLTFNPVSASHWIKARFFDYKSKDIFICHSTYLDNRFIDEAYHKRMMVRKELDPEGYRVYGLGFWGELGGQILTNFQVHDFIVNEYAFDDMAIGADWGFNHATAILVLGIKDGEIYVCSEIYEFEKRQEEIIEIAEETELPRHIFMWCDSAEPATIKTWRMAGWRSAAVKKEQGSVKAQIRWLKDRKIHIHPSCKNTIKEMQAWKWIKDSTTGLYTDEPVKFQDDAMAALRYGIEGWRKKRRYNVAKEFATA